SRTLLALPGSGPRIPVKSYQVLSCSLVPLVLICLYPSCIVLDLCIHRIV
ncbi:hypothetical protein BCR43DRAFT_456081, partial [Syncephalastrum racemosum]